MDIKQLTEIEARLNSATPGPWITMGGSIASGSVGNIRCIATFFGDNRIADGELAAHAPTDIAALIAEVRKLQAELAEAQDAFVDGLSIPE